jgi:hypothetical protein
VAQGDAIRNITGYMGGDRIVGVNRVGAHASGVISAAFSSNPTDAGGSRSGHGFYTVDINASRVVPTAAENRPVNVAVRYLIRALK